MLYKTVVEVCDTSGVYPKISVLLGLMGYATYRKIPLFLHTDMYDGPNNSAPSPLLDIFHASLQITRQQFPAYLFPKYSNRATIVFNRDSLPSLRSILSIARRIMSGKRSVLVINRDERLYHSGLATYDREYLDSLPEYMLFPLNPNLSFAGTIEEWNKDYVLSWYTPSINTIRKYFSLFVRSSRYVKIGLHYFVHACNLMHLHYIEEAGLNLHLAVDSIVADFMTTHRIRNRARAIELLRSSVTLPLFHMEFLEDLHFARNEFLAHIDTDMFTSRENINDPDGYCYEHYESVCWLITRYVEYKNRIGG